VELNKKSETEKPKKKMITFAVDDESGDMPKSASSVTEP
jgi:hypothetical protein